MSGNPSLEDLRRLEADFARAMEQLYAVGNGLAKLRHDVEAPSGTVAPQPVPAPGGWPAAGSPMHGAPVPMPPPVPLPAPTQLAVPQPARAVIPPLPPPVTLPRPQPTNALSRWWRNESVVTRVLGVAGAVVTLAGLVMLLVLAVQQQWFGPVPRVVLGALVALGLIALSQVVHARESRAGRRGTGALALAATGYAAAYLVVVAVTAIYDWVPPLAGLVLGVLVVASGLFIARRWNSQFLAVLLLLGAALMLPSLVTHSSWLLSAFMVVIALGAWPAQLGRNWPIATMARLSPAACVLIVATLVNQQRPEEPWASLVVCAVLALGGLVLATLDRHNAAPWLNTLAVVVTALPVLVAISPTPMPWRTVIFLFTAVAYLGYAALGESQRWLPLTLTLPAAGVGTLALLLAIVARSDTSWAGTGLLVMAVAYLGVAAFSRSRVALVWGLVVTAIALSAYLRHPLTVLVERTALRSDLAVTLVDSVVAGALVVLLAWVARRGRVLDPLQRRVVGSVSWVAGLVVSTTGVVAAGVLLGKVVDSAEAGFRAGHAVATILWMAAAAWLLVRGLRRTDDADLTMWLGLGLAAAAVVKLFVYDLAVLQGIWRVVAFMVVGLLLLGTGVGYAKALERARAAKAPKDPVAPVDVSP